MLTLVATSIVLTSSTFFVLKSKYHGEDFGGSYSFPSVNSFIYSKR